MRWLLVVLVALALAVGLAELVLDDAGYVLLAWQNWRVETSVWVALGLWLGAWLVLWLAWRGLTAALTAPGAVRGWWRHRRERRHYRKTMTGLKAYLEGDWARARKLLQRHARGGLEPAVNFLFAARATYRLGEPEAAEDLVREAELVSRDRQSAALMRAEIQLETGQHELCLATLLRLREELGDHMTVLRLLMRTYDALADWQALETLLPVLKKKHVLPADELSQLEFRVYTGRLALGEGQGRDDVIQKLADVWNELPARVKRRPRVVAVYAESLLKAGAEPTAERALRHALRREWDNELVRLYGRVRGADSNKQLVLAESWLPSRPNNATLLLTLGRLALRNELWGKAREYFEASLRLSPSAEVHAELGRLLAHLGEHEASTRHFEQGLLVSTDGLPDLPMPSPRAAS